MRGRPRESNISAFSCKSAFLASSFLRGGRIKTLEACYDNDSSQSDRNTGSWPEAHASLTSYRQDHSPPPTPGPLIKQRGRMSTSEKLCDEKISLPALFWQMFLFDSVKSGGNTAETVCVCVCVFVGGWERGLLKDFLVAAAKYELDGVSRDISARNCQLR